MHFRTAVGCFSVTCSTFVDSVRIQSANTIVCVSTVYSGSIFTHYFTKLFCILHLVSVEHFATHYTHSVQS